MGQRLGIAAALPGDPAILLGGEPVNTVDPERAAQEIGQKVASDGIELYELTPEQASLEDAFMHLPMTSRPPRTPERAP